MIRALNRTLLNTRNLSRSRVIIQQKEAPPQLHRHFQTSSKAAKEQPPLKFKKPESDSNQDQDSTERISGLEIAGLVTFSIGIVSMTELFFPQKRAVTEQAAINGALLKIMLGWPGWTMGGEEKAIISPEQPTMDNSGDG